MFSGYARISTRDQHPGDKRFLHVVTKSLSSAIKIAS